MKQSALKNLRNHGNVLTLLKLEIQIRNENLSSRISPLQLILMAVSRKINK